MKKFRLILLLLTLTSATGVSAQENRCALKIADLPQAPDLLGFRLGMTTEQVKSRIPQVIFGPTDEFGVSKTSINPHFDPRIDKTNLEDVRTISLDFLDGQLTSLWIGYERTFKWSNIDDFVKGISQSLSLPQAWTTWRSRGQQLRCSEFQITVTMVAGGPSFRLVDGSSEYLVAARQQAKEALTENEESREEEIVADSKVRIYYLRGCQPERPIVVTNRVVFRTADEAEQAGYKRSPQCE